MSHLTNVYQLLADDLGFHLVAKNHIVRINGSDKRYYHAVDFGNHLFNNIFGVWAKSAAPDRNMATMAIMMLLILIHSCYLTLLT